MFARGEQEKGIKKMEQPIKTALAERYEEKSQAYNRAFNELNSGRFIRRDWDDARSDEQREEIIENLAGYFSERQETLTTVTALFEELRTPEMLQGEREFTDWKSQNWRWHEYRREMEAYEQDPERYSLHALAVLAVKRRAEEEKGVKWSKLTNYYYEAGVHRTAHNLTLEEQEAMIDDYIEARQMSYTVSTKNLKMKVA